MKKQSLDPVRRHARAVSGFTLLELLVVVAIIGMLAAYVGPKYFGVLGNTEQKSARAQIKLLSDAVKLYRLDVGTYPTTQQGLNALLQQPGGVSGWKGPYLEKKGVPLDPWKKAYMYRFPGTDGRDFDVYSYGSDGQPGGADNAADVTD
ncbi:type II secretion system major pseudopilin GspG [Uliginosibacterium sp. H1]|uniref:type II secretion system major pseudopilin GspG n=1 Tax=Uliginosibacterium sp. H1 TaxID=3114757 RepID=UPI002E1720C3|nr:type II secretion system major pseudopilin GspG [Uliginosibacterium sp. H1]